MKKNLLLIIGSFIMAFILLPISTAFASPLNELYKDYNPKAYWAEPMEWAVSKGVIKGYAAEMLLKPYGTLTQAQWTAILMRYATGGEVKDAGVGDWSKPYFEAAKLDNLYTPNEPSKSIRRGDTARMLAEIYTGLTKSEEEAVTWMYENNITTGVNPNLPKDYSNYNANGFLTRGQAVTFLHRAIEKKLVPSLPIKDFVEEEEIEDEVVVYPDGWIAPKIKSKWKQDDPIYNLAVFEKELGLRGGWALDLNERQNVLMVGFHFSEISATISHHFWTDESYEDSYKVHVISKELFKFFFGKDAERVYQYYETNTVPAEFIANGLKVKSRMYQRYPGTNNEIFAIFIGKNEEDFEMPKHDWE